MNTLKYLILLIPILTISCSKHDVILTEDQLPDDIFYLKDEIKPFTGRCLVYFYKTEILKEEINFRNGILDGSHISYYKNGVIKRIGHYREGNFNGKWTGYDTEGNKTFEVEYKNDTLIGRFISWYSTGVIKQKGSYHNNVQIGEWISYDEAGMITKKVIL
jgi:antitoxin component YwqK of YwqJK toxin-antitoxin module